MSEIFETKIAVIVREDLAVWQKLNVATFTISGVAGMNPDALGKPYMDATGNHYLPMFRQPILVFSATHEKMKTAYQRAMRRGVRLTIFSEELFSTFNDEDNRTAVKKASSEELNLVGMAFREDRKTVDKVMKGIRLHS